MRKGGFADGIVQVAILLSLLRTDINNYFNGMDTPEITEIILGQSLAYSQTQFHSPSWHSRYSGQIISPKAVDNDYFVNSIMRDLQALQDNRHQIRAHHDTQLDAWLVSDITERSVAEMVSGHIGPVGGGTEASQGALTGGTGSDQHNSETSEGPAGILQPSTSSSFSQADDLTKEDMDLIEILWQQDIDLGISRNAFDANLREKSQAYEIEQHEKPEPLEKPHDDSPPAGFSVDSETGEWISIPVVPQSQDVEPLLIIPNASDEENTTSVTPLDETFDIDEAMKILEAQLAEHAAIDPVETAQTSFEVGEPDIIGDQIPRPLVDEIENLNSMVPNTALNSLQDEQLATEGRFLTDAVVPIGMTPPDPSFARPMYEPHHTPPMFSRMMSMEQRWDDLTSIMLDDVSQVNDTEMFPPTGYPLEPESPASNLMPQFNSSLPTSSNDTNYDFGASDVLFPNVSSIEPALPERNESLIELLKSDDIEKMEFDEFPDVDTDMNAEHSPEDSTEQKRPRQTSLCTTTSESYADSAISGMSSPCGEMDDDAERNNSPYDCLLGATGGSYQSSPRGGKSKDDFYDSDGSFSDYSSSRQDSHLNYSSSSNDTGRRPSASNIQNVNHNHTYHTQPGQPPREVKQYVKKEKDKVKESRDEKRIKSLKLPLSVDEIVEMPVDDLNQYMQEKPLTEDQLQLIKDIRRRGKNKVAAQNCRKRKMDEIDELQEEIDKFKENGAQLRVARRNMEDEMSAMRRKYDNLYAEVFKSLKDSDGDPYNPDLYSLQMTSDGAWVLMPRNTTTTVERRRETKAEPKKRTHSKRKK